MPFREEANERKLRAQLEALNEAALAITAELSLDRTLQRIVDLARDLAGARYAALGVPDAQGGLEQFVVSGMTPQAIKRLDHLPRGEGLLGLLLRQPNPIRVADIHTDPRSAGFCANHPPMHSFLGVPIVSHGKLLGNLYLTDKFDAPEFDASDERLITLLAAHAAVAIDNAQLYREVGRLAVVEERERIGMELHDGIIQSIYAVGLTLEYASLVLDEQPQAARERLNQAIAGLNDVIRDIRSYILDMRPQRFAGKDLATGLAELVRAFRANTFIEVDLDVEPQVSERVKSERAAGLFHIAQEGLANIAKHARARHVGLSLRRERDGLLLELKDDGRGFDPQLVSSYAGHGMRNMEERARLLNGEWRVESAPNAGTRIQVRVPLDPR
jgi:signal transduction histidine kinase